MKYVLLIMRTYIDGGPGGSSSFGGAALIATGGTPGTKCRMTPTSQTGYGGTGGSSSGSGTVYVASGGNGGFAAYNYTTYTQAAGGAGGSAGGGGGGGGGTGTAGSPSQAAEVVVARGITISLEPILEGTGHGGRSMFGGSFFYRGLVAEINIQADPQVIWNILIDFPKYGQWNQAIPVAEGKAEVGEVLKVVIHWPGLKENSYKLRVLSAVPPRELTWLGRFGMKGLMDGEHRFVIDSIGPSLCKVTQMEEFSGLLVPFFSPWLKGNVLKGFEQMNLALKARAES